MHLPENISKYLRNYDLNKWAIETFQDRLYNNIIVIPALDELSNINKLLAALSINLSMYLNETLIVIVVNNTISEESNVVEENKNLLDYLRKRNKINPNLNLGIVDASTDEKALPKKNGGVGLARKIGMDLSLKYFDYGNDRKKILISLDADCLVSNDYLKEIVESFNNENLHAAVIRFEHILPENEMAKSAIINYEIFLRYYVLGLKYANSHFAFPSVGSTIVCDVESYLKVGGMNNKKAGEDFYFLEKLAKNNIIYQLNHAIVYPSSRISNRVPFGTGPRIKRFLENPDDEYLLYSLKVFKILKKWLEVFSDIKTLRNSEKLLESAKTISVSLYNFLIDQDFERTWNKIIRNSKTEEQLIKQNIVWMDGFKTLKLIHYLRDNSYPNESMFDVLDELFINLQIDHKLKHSANVPSLNIQKKYLDILRMHT